MNATGNHTMGSTISTFDPNSSDVTMNQQARTLMAPLTTSVPPGVPGLDVSSYQTTTAATWRSVYANGGRFVYVKATESTNYTSDTFSEQYSDSYNAGLIHGAYHFAHPNSTSGATQANFFVNNGGGWSNDGRTLPPLLDIEYNPSGATCYGMSQSAMVSWIADFSKTVQSRTGRLPAIYTTTDWWTRCTGNTGKFAANPLFIARYPIRVSDGPGTLPNGWSQYTMWQWADAGTFPGDQDVFNGTLTDLRTFARNATGVLPMVGGCDLTGDRVPDLVLSKSDGTLWLAAGDGRGGYGSATQIGTGWGAFNSLFCAGRFDTGTTDDLIARKTDGTLWLYSGTGKAGGLEPGVQIGTGWQSFTQILSPGDMSGDNIPDVLAVKPSGALMLYRGSGTGRTTGPATQIGSGWTFSSIIGAGDMNADGRADLLGLTSGGALWLYPQASPGRFAPRVQARSGWSVFDTVVAGGDTNGDGAPDIVARKPDGSLWVSSGQTIFFSSARQIATGWGAYNAIASVGDFNGDDRADLIARKADGTLWLNAATGSGGFSPAQQIGHGWNALNSIVGVGDFSGDGRADVIGRRADGTLWLYRGDGSGGFIPGARQIGHGWDVFNTIIGAGDLTGDGNVGLLGRKRDGSLWLYPGTGAGGFCGARLVGHGWDVFNTIVAGDLTGDGHQDLVGRQSDGTLSLYPTTPAVAGGLATPVNVGTGWNLFG
jgi:GH25 family lysozyme M1 (1,4-beta-N-acetylmuramidase)